jgi:biopolymer transport protein ExbD
MASLFQRSKQRRKERAPMTSEGGINLVPLVDILTSIVFFSLLTYTGAVMAELTAYDLSLPPVVVTAPGQMKPEDKALNLLLAVRIENNSLQVEHSEENGFKQRINGLDEKALDQLQGLMTQIRQKYKQNSDVLVVPSDEVSYDDVVKVLERLRLAQFTGISLGNRSRVQVAAGATAPAR